MTNSVRNHLDVSRFRQEKRIVVLDLSPGLNQLTSQVASGIGGMVLNEIISSARVAASCGLNLPETVVVLDEFQDYASKDLLEALPQTRQLGLSFVFAHQSMSQLKQSDFDMTDIVWQAQNVAFFRNYGVDGDIVAQEKAVYDYDENDIKDERKTSRQKNVGHRIVITRGGGTTNTHTSSRSTQNGKGSGTGFNRPLDLDAGKGTTNSSDNKSTGYSDGNSDGVAEQSSWRETLLPILEDVEEVSGVTYRQFEEVFNIRRRETRQLPVGQCYFKAADKPTFRQLAIDPLFITDTNYILDQLAQFEDRNSSSNLFVPAWLIDQEDETLRKRILYGGSLSNIDSSDSPISPPGKEEPKDDGLFG